MGGCGCPAPFLFPKVALRGCCGSVGVGQGAGGGGSQKEIRASCLHVFSHVSLLTGLNLVLLGLFLALWGGVGSVSAGESQ